MPRPSASAGQLDVLRHQHGVDRAERDRGSRRSSRPACCPTTMRECRPPGAGPGADRSRGLVGSGGSNGERESARSDPWDDTPQQPACRVGVPVLAALALTIVLVLSGCSAVLRIGEDSSSRDANGASTSVRVSVERAGLIAVVRIPTARPAGGVRVTPSEGHAFRVPPDPYPPRGACRIWNPDVPPGCQSPPEDCDELERRAPAGSYLIVG